MKYTKLFNNHSEYVAYIASESFIRPNVSYCIQEDESHCTPMHDTCIEQHIYEIMGDPSYPSSVPASATSFELSFTYTDTYTSVTCDQGSFMDGDTVTIPIEENPSTSARTITGTYVFHDISIPYSFTQEGKTAPSYDQQYLTFDILTGGTILWKASNTGVTRTISYSINDGEWTEITSTTGGVSINVSAGDKVLMKGTNVQYGTDSSNYNTFSGTAYFNLEGNIMSLIGGDDFSGLTSFNGYKYNFRSFFDHSNVVSAENLILPVTAMTTGCYRGMFANCSSLTTPPALPATTLGDACYYYMFDKDVAMTVAPALPATTMSYQCYFGMFHQCTSLTTAPVLPAATLANQCYQQMFSECSSLNYIKCLATDISANGCLTNWVNAVASTGTFVKNPSMSSWTVGANGIPTGWIVQDEGMPDIPTISCNGLEIELSCATAGADIYYQLDHSGSYSLYSTAITMTGDTFIECYSEKNGYSSTTTSMTCEYDDRTIYEYSNQSIDNWTRSGSAVTAPNSVNAIDGHSASYSKGTFNYEASVNLRSAQPTYLWFQHADQSATIYVDNTQVEKHWGGYNAFFVDISNNVHKGTNNIKVALKNNEGDNLAPASGDFNFNATLGEVKLFTSPCLPAMDYGYDGFHITSTVSTASATINVATNIPTGATVTCTISGTNCSYTATSASTGAEMVFTTTINNPHLWNGTIDPYLYNVKLEIYYNNELYHRYERPYGLRFYEYVINETVSGSPYTGFLLNGEPYLLRGCCMHDDIAGKANALDDADYTQQFSIVTELGLNFLRLSHYPHPKEVYDWCDRLGIIVETEVPCVNHLQTTMPEAYYEHLVGQYNDMVNQHYNHPCIVFWGLSNEAKVTDSNEGREFAKTKIEAYTSQIKALDSERLVGLVGHAITDPLSYFGNPTTIDWIGSNLYEGWYQNPTSNNPTTRLNTCISNTITSASKAYAFSEYGCGGTQHCHSENPSSTTNKGSGGARHDIEYQMWLHEGHIAAIKNKPELLFTSQWVLFDFAVANRNEGYTICLDGENTTIDDELRRLNDKGLVERDHVTKKDTYYLYKAWWNSTNKFVHICCKDYIKGNDRVIKCYTNDGNSLTLYVNGVSAETVSVTNNIATFTARNFNGGEVVMVSGATTSDTFTVLAETKIVAKFNVTSTSDPTLIGYDKYISGFSAIEIDGIAQQSIESAYTFSTTGEHTVKYTLTDNTTITNYAFYACTGLTSVSIPNSVATIEGFVFNSCRSLSSITMPNSIMSIGSYAFGGCDSLTSVNIPSSVTTINEYAFSYCSGLTSITCNAATPPTLGYSAFDDTNNCPIYVLCESVDTYKAASSWSTYANRIGAIAGSCSIVATVNVTDTTSPTKVASGTSNFIKIEIDGVEQQSVTTGYTFSSTGEHTVKYYLTGTSIITDNFRACAEITSVVIPDSVTSIGQAAFRYCTGMTNCTIGSGVTSIGNSAFYDCYGLTNCTIPDSVTSIGGGAFQNCTSLTSCTIGSGVTSIGSGTFQGCSGLTSITIPDGVSTVNQNLFNGCTSLTSCTIGSGVTKIDDWAFANCTSLTTCTIGSGVTSIGNYVFNYCASLTTVNIPSGVTSIGIIAFDHCTSLTSITIPDSVTSIGRDAFNNCTSLSSCTIGNGITSIESNTFNNCISLTSITIPNGVTSIGNNAFVYCSGLTNVNIPSGVTSIEGNTFLGCSSLTSITIPSGVTNIGNSAFQSCSSLTSITIPSGVTSIGNNVLRYSSGLTSIIVEAATPPTLGTYVFQMTNNCPIYVPSVSVDTYKSASGWSSYASRIQPIA